jgi:hypothetical protein
MTAAGRAVSRLPKDAPPTSIYSAGFLFEGSQMAIDDLGRHPPGANRIIVPTPPPMVLPERKIISATEAARWHEMRGGAVAAEEEAGDPILLTDLVAGWALTSGPQQTLDSSGVIASGPLDFPPKDITYSANGALYVGVGSATLNLPLAGALLIGDQDFFVSAEFAVSIAGEAANLTYDTFWGSTLFAGQDTPPAQVSSFLAEPDEDYSELVVTPPAYSTRFCFDYWYDHLTDTLSMSINNAAATTASLVGGTHEPDATSLFQITCSSTLPIRRVRYVIGDISAWVASRTWRYNSGAGRDDAEIAAYTG